MKLTPKNLTSKQKAFKNQQGEFKQYCKELGGFIYIYCDENKKFLNDINISNSSVFRLIYLATYMDYNNREENVLVKHGYCNKLEYLTRKDLQKLLNLSNTPFKEFLKEVKRYDLLICKDKKYYISKKYFSKGKLSYKNNKKAIKLFINPIREIYSNTDKYRYRPIGELYRLIPFINEDNILINNNINIKRIEIAEICKMGMSKSNISRRMDEYKEIVFKDEPIFYETKEYCKISPKIAITGTTIKDMELEMQKEFTSFGEQKIKTVLDKYKIEFKEEYVFKDLIGTGGGNLRYDFYLPQYNLLIEFQGQQHKDYVPYIHGSYSEFLRVKDHDRLKRLYAAKNGIDLLEIRYYNQDNIEYIITNHLGLE